jgi:hypothetical protein
VKKKRLSSFDLALFGCKCRDQIDCQGHCQRQSAFIRSQHFELWRRKVQQNRTSHTTVRQPFDSLAVAQPLPIVDISRRFTRKKAHLPVIFYLNQSIGHSRGGKDFRSGGKGRSNRLLKCQNTGQCGPGSPCPDGSCCNNNGACVYGPENCGSGNCTDNCKPSLCWPLARSREASCTSF